MDQAAPPHQGVLWNQRKRREDANLDRRVGLCAGRDPQEVPGVRTQSPPNSTGSQRDPVRENPHSTGLPTRRLQRSISCNL